jgi:hypothetical protein
MHRNGQKENKKTQVAGIHQKNKRGHIRGDYEAEYDAALKAKNVRSVILCLTSLHFTRLYCTVLHCPVPYVLQCAILDNPLLHHTLLRELCR